MTQPPPESRRTTTTLIAPPFTAFHPDGSLHLDLIERQAESLRANRIRGAFVCGTTGEGASLSTRERMQVAERWCQVKGNLEIIVHVGHAGIADARDLAAHARQIGADGVAALAPFFFKPRTVDELVGFCAVVASEAPELPFYYYHIPALTGVTLPVADFLDAARDRIPNLAGAKFTYEDLMDYGRCLDRAAGRLEIFFGRDEMLLGALALGATSAVGTTYNFLAPLFHRLTDAFARGDLETAQAAQAQARAIIAAFLRFGGLPAMKAAMRWVGLDCGPFRPPFATPADADLATLRETLERLDFAGATGVVPNGAAPYSK